ncbi:MAG: transposase [Opitutales bacterium]|nr:transposase [Opitutales bacterium]
MVRLKMGEIRIKNEDGPAVYHVTSRVIQRRRLLAEGQREVWVAALHRAADFSGVEVITYCVLETHFHILVRIDPAARLCDDATLVRRYRALYGEARAQWSGLNADELAHALEGDPPEAAERLRERLRRRMGDISEFMRTLRQRYTRWFNRAHETAGTLWAERFGSVLVQDTPWLVGLIAAYIDLNAVRAGLTDLPENYRWCGYTEALAGNEGRCRALAACFPAAKDTKEALACYRLLMLGKGAAAKGDGTGARIDPAALLEAVKNGGELEPHELLRLRVRYFTEGRALGSVDWLERGEGARVLAKLNRPPPRRPVELLDNADLAVARSRARYRVAEDPRR